MTVPLRYCKHKDAEGKERGVIPEGECLVEMLGGQAKGNEVRKNKNHFVLAAADWDEGIKDEKDRRRLEVQRREKRKTGELDEDARRGARMIPGVPIIYVKKSVMILEEPSAATDKAVRGIEKDKYKDGIGGAVRASKRKREDEEDDSGSDETEAQQATKKKRKGPKEPNPLSIKKKKKDTPAGGQPNGSRQDATQSTKPKRRRGKRGKGGDSLEKPIPESSGAQVDEHDSS